IWRAGHHHGRDPGLPHRPIGRRRDRAAADRRRHARRRQPAARSVSGDQRHRLERRPRHAGRPHLPDDPRRLRPAGRRPPAYRRTGYLPHPVGPKGRPIAPLGGYALTIPANIAAERIEPVWIALRALTSANTTKLYLANGSLASPRFSLSRDPEIRALSPMV